MKNILDFDDFLNEKINWSKKPWRTLKNIMQLEETDEEDEPGEFDKKKYPKKEVQHKNPNKLSEADIKINTSYIFRTKKQIEDLVTRMAKDYDLEVNINNYGHMMNINVKGKLNNIDNYDKALKKAIDIIK